jgi:Tol biopolymer transport system component
MTKKGMALWLAVFLLCSGMTAWAEEEASPGMASERLIAHIDFSAWAPKSFKVSPDGTRLAYGAKAGNKWFVVVDGKEGKQYNIIMEGTPLFSPDSKRVAYDAQLDNKRCVIMDGKEEKQYDGIGAGSLVFSPDSKRLAYVAGVRNKWLAVVDGKEGKQYDGIVTIGGGRIIFDSAEHLHYLAQEGSNIYLVKTRESELGSR